MALVVTIELLPVEELPVEELPVGVASFDRHTGKRTDLTSKLGWRIGPEISSLVKWPRSGLETGSWSLLRREEVGEESPLSGGSLFDDFFSFFSD